MFTASQSLVCVLGAAVATTVSMLLLLPWLRRRVLDQPNARSSHTTPTPRGAGAAVIAGLVVGCLVAGESVQTSAVALIVMAAIVLGALGLMDDLGGLNVGIRFASQAVVATSLVLTVGQLYDVADVVLICITVVVVVGYTNAFNFMDGINGISALNATVAALWFAFLGHRVHQPDLLYASLALCGAVAVFLPWNFPKARTFLGDVGSYSIGVFLGGMAFALWRDGATVWAAVAPLVIYAADTGFTLLRRVVGRRPWREAHREHVYQQLVDGGLSHAVVASAVALFSLAECGAWYLLHGLGSAVAVVGMALLAVLYLALPALGRREQVVVS